MARTTPAVDVHERVGGITGANADITCALTNDATTTAEINKRGFSHGTVENHTGSALTITWWASMTAGGTAHALQDEDGAAVTTVFAGDHAVAALPSAIAGVAYLIPVSNAATDTVVVHLER